MRNSMTSRLAGKSGKKHWPVCVAAAVLWRAASPGRVGTGAG